MESFILYIKPCLLGTNSLKVEAHLIPWIGYLTMMIVMIAFQKWIPLTFWTYKHWPFVFLFSFKCVTLFGTPSMMHWRYYSLALSHQYRYVPGWQIELFVDDSLSTWNVILLAMANFSELPCLCWLMSSAPVWPHKSEYWLLTNNHFHKSFAFS